ncbi:MAG: hypothetical protein D6813_02185 [Calditrichaeota bacterium]|nr:MAG: hypothetical protein D6813_02185 [Calditrichota bacterium]
MLFHTSLLVDLDVPFMLRVLKIPVEKLADKKASRSVEQRITTICREVGRKISLDQVRQTVKQAFEEFFQINFETRSWSEEERKQIETLAQTKYQSEDWLFQRSPQPDMEGMSLRKTPAGLIRTYIGLKGETIKSVLITGDFFEHSETLSLIESKLKWSAFTKAEIHRVVHSVLSRNGQPFKMLTTEDLTEAIWKAGLNARAKNRLTHQGACYFPEGALLME